MEARCVGVYFLTLRVARADAPDAAFAWPLGALAVVVATAFADLGSALSRQQARQLWFR